ncbi:linear amide C-N hydrolase [Aliivibrio fischeri]|uniref:linear amide C-N hydrolase n=1 Tax=Aliivibrio fischeri TaxID=668 RepID=UPI0006D2C5CC|nr:linear amide C-N hydrolase [Aliivibrio fischeri]MUH95976.1 linear amide C-N hydrolase [Aliivibrio fischeri]MUI62745.1 linear amide C-N hydrolase [Aliivibrio fischeri]USR96923.1 linear amide C-N hydrolase [Aliivibrio fischeri ATCC 7744 = JCM 18803 = DSM 507]GGK37955.1 choloylglycine hydrolase [Aliivibrio fischeri]
MNKFIKTTMCIAALFSSISFACTTVGWLSDYGMIISRTQDWSENSFPTLTRIEAGTVRNLHGTPTGDTYKTKYTIAGILAYSGLIHDAVNEKGLQMNGLYYKPMTLPKAEKDSVSQLELGGYILAMYSSVEEAVTHLKTLKVGSVSMPGAPAPILLHWAITDKTGDRAVIEYDADGLKIYRGEDAMVMTNQPSQQIHLDNVKTIKKFGPGVNFGSKGNTNPEDRFKEATYFRSQLKGATSSRNAMLKVFSVAPTIPQDAANILNGKKSTYATEWQMTTNLTTGETIFSYHFNDTWNNLEWNYKSIIENTDFKPLPLYK